MHSKPPPAGDSNRHLHRTALLPYCGECFDGANVGCIGELVDGFDVVGFNPRRTSTLRRCLATGLALHRYGLWSLRLPTPYATALKKSEFGHRGLISLIAGILPWLRLRSVLRASCPSDARGMNRHRDFGYIGTCFDALNVDSFDDVPLRCNAVSHHPRSRSASAGRDSLRSVGHAANAATSLTLEPSLML
jgi:hypothetical protein